MAITLVGTPQTGNNNNGGNFTLTFSTAPIEDDVVIVLAANGNDLDNQNVGLVTSGYTEEGDLAVADDYHTKVFSKRMGASPDTTVEIDGGGDTQNAVAGVAYVFRGVDTTTLLDAVITTAQQAGTNWDPVLIVTVTDDAWVLAVGAGGGNASATVYPTNYINGFTIARTDTHRVSVAGATREIASNGSEDPGAFTWASAGAGGFTIALRPASGDATANLTAINAAVTVDAPTTTTSASVTTTAVNAIVTLTTVATTTSNTATLTAVNVVVTVDQPTVTGGTSITLIAIAATVTINPFPDRDVIPAPITTTASLPAVTAQAGDATANLTTVQAIVTIPTVATLRRRLSRLPLSLPSHLSPRRHRPPQPPRMRPPSMP